MAGSLACRSGTWLGCVCCAPTYGSLQRWMHGTRLSHLWPHWLWRSILLLWLGYGLGLLLLLEDRHLKGRSCRRRPLTILLHLSSSRPEMGPSNEWHDGCQCVRAWHILLLTFSVTQQFLTVI